MLRLGPAAGVLIANPKAFPLHVSIYSTLYSALVYTYYFVWAMLNNEIQQRIRHNPSSSESLVYWRNRQVIMKLKCGT